MPRLRVSTPLWLAQRAPREQPRYPALARDRRVDVAVVGGGVTGAAIAWMFATRGIRVALLEASLVGRGSTAASTALLMQEPDTDFVELIRRYGPKRARRIWRLSRNATHDFIRTVETLGIRCGLQQRDSVYYALGEGSGRRLRREFLRRRQAGIAGRWLDAAALRRAAGLDGSGAIRTHGDAQLDPYRACTGLLRAAARRGARVFERSPVDRIESDANGVTLAVNGVAVRCARVVIATGYATPYFEPLAARFRMLQTYIVATERLAARARRDAGIGDVMLWDTGRPYHYARWTADHRLLLGGGDRPRVAERQRARALRAGASGVRRFFERRYPALKAVADEFQWEGLFATTPDGLPYIGPHPDYPKHLFALGYGGNGMTFGFLAARLLVGWYRERPSDDHRLFAFDRDE